MKIWSNVKFGQFNNAIMIQGENFVIGKKLKAM